MSKDTKSNKPKKEPKAKQKPAAPEEVTLSWNLIDLPTAQHKAGLAGLIVAIRSLNERSRNDPQALPPDEVPIIVDGPTHNLVEIRFTRKSHGRLIADVYDADPTESEPREKPRTKGKGANKKIIEPFRRQTMTVVSKAGKEKQADGYVYLDAIPRLTAIRSALAEHRLWLRLWHDFLKNVVRDGKKWTPYRLTAASKSPEAAKYMLSESDDDEEADAEGAGTEEKSTGDATSWQDLVRIAEARGKEPVFGSLSSALLLGAQAFGPERIGFKGRIEHNLLLHFWPLVVMPTVPWLINREGKPEETGYVLAIPEVSELDRFCDRWPEALSRLSPGARQFRPAQAVIDLPAQGALEFANSVAQIESAKESNSPTRSVGAVEFMHLDRQGNNVKLMTSGRVPVERELLQAYREIVGDDFLRPPYRNPLLRAALIQALLQSKPWWSSLLPLFMNRHHRFFINLPDTASVAPDISRLPWFWSDIRARLYVDHKLYKERKASPMSTNPEPKPLQLLVNQLVRTYVRARAEFRSQIRLPDRVDDWDKVDPRYKLKQSEVAEALFLEFRSRRDQAFVDHFAQTFFATKQYLSDEDQLILANALFREGQADEVKTLTLMSLSANS